MKRIIPCLDIKDGKTVKGVNFVGLKEIGDPIEIGKKYEADGATELVLLDITATVEGRKTFVDLVKRAAANITIPFTVGGGITSVEDAKILLEAGAAKVAVNSASVSNPALINAIAEAFGSDSLVAAIDAKMVDGKWIVTTHGGNKLSNRELFEWAKEVEQRGAGQILFTSMDHDGMKIGYPTETYARLAETVSIPIIASGGAGSVEHIVEVLTVGKADAALAASVFHYGEVTIPELRARLAKENISIR